MTGHVSAEPVVPLEASFHVTGEADVVAVRMCVAVEDVDKAPGCHDHEQGRNDAGGACDGSCAKSQAGA